MKRYSFPEDQGQATIFWQVTESVGRDMCLMEKVNVKIIYLFAHFHFLYQFVLFQLICPLLPHSRGFPGESDGKEFSSNAGDLDWIPGSGKSPGGENGYTLQYSCLENSKDKGAWWAIILVISKSWTGLNN